MAALPVPVPPVPAVRHDDTPDIINATHACLVEMTSWYKTKDPVIHAYIVLEKFKLLATVCSNFLIHMHRETPLTPELQQKILDIANILRSELSIFELFIDDHVKTNLSTITSNLERIQLSPICTEGHELENTAKRDFQRLANDQKSS